MKIRVTMKDPDTLMDAIREAMDSFSIPGLDEEEIDSVRQSRVNKTYEMCCKNWFQYGEYLEVEIDTEAKTCTVVTRV